MRGQKRSNRMFIEKDLLASHAWLDLGGISAQIYLLFRLRCQVMRPKGLRTYTITNNGELSFSYAEAKRKFGVTAPRFRRAIDDLVTHGFIDITGTGMGVHKILTTYAVSERWRSWGEPTFVQKERPKPSISNPGFRKGNKLTPQKLSSDENVHGAVNKNVVPPPITVNENVVPENCDKPLPEKQLSQELAEIVK
jgi:hypothetical protein